MENEIKGLPLQVGDLWRAASGETARVKEMVENGVAMVQYQGKDKEPILRVWVSTGSLAEEPAEEGDELLQLVELEVRDGKAVDPDLVAEESAPVAEAQAEAEQSMAPAAEAAAPEAPEETPQPTPQPAQPVSILRVDPERLARLLADRPEYTDTGKIILRNVEIGLSDEQRLNILEEIDRTHQKKEDAEEIFKAQQKRHKELVKSLDDEIARQLKIKRDGSYTSERKCVVLQNLEMGVQVVVCVDTNEIIESGPIALVQAEMFSGAGESTTPETPAEAPAVDQVEQPAEEVGEQAPTPDTTEAPAPETGESPAADRDPFDVGFEMGRAKSTANPYPPGSAEGIRWLKGWRDGHASVTGAGKRKAPELDTDQVVSEGILACEASKDVIECPYQEGTPERERWLVGWSRHHDRSLKTQIKAEKIKGRRKAAKA